MISDMILREKVIAVLRGYETETALRVAEALRKGGIRLVEFPFDQHAPESWESTVKTIRAFTNEDMLIGAGTVTTLELVDLAADAGAGFIVSPNTKESVIQRTIERKLVSIAGAMTPTEILTAHDAGADFVKLFPAGYLGTAYLKTIRQPVNHVNFLVFGGIDENNITDFLDAGAVGAGVGNCLVKREWVENGAYAKITEAAKRLLERIG